MFFIYLGVCYLLLCFIAGLIRAFYNILSGGFGFKDRLEFQEHMKMGFYIGILILIMIIIEL